MEEHEPATCSGLGLGGGDSAAVEAVELLGVPSVERRCPSFVVIVLLSLLAATPYASAWVIPLPVILNLLANLLRVLVAVAFAAMACCCC